MEIEAKFRIDDAGTFIELLRLDQIGPFDLVPAPVPEQQHNTYFDTADGRLRAQRHGLRLRLIGARRLITLKANARFHDGLYERDEWEFEIGDDIRPAAWPSGEARARVLSLIEGAPLLPILTIETMRHHIHVAREGLEFAEISLDEGRVVAGGREEPFRELEIELLVPGQRADFDQLVATLRQRLALIPEDQSKLARGLALLDQAAT